MAWVLPPGRNCSTGKLVFITPSCTVSCFVMSECAQNEKQKRTERTTVLSSFTVCLFLLCGLFNANWSTLNLASTSVCLEHRDGFVCVRVCTRTGAHAASQSSTRQCAALRSCMKQFIKKRFYLKVLFFHYYYYFYVSCWSFKVNSCSLPTCALLLLLSYMWLSYIISLVCFFYFRAKQH